MFPDYYNLIYAIIPKIDSGVFDMVILSANRYFLL